MASESVARAESNSLSANALCDFPQAVLAMLPPYGNLLIELLKGSVLVSLVNASEGTSATGW